MRTHTEETSWRGIPVQTRHMGLTLVPIAGGQATATLPRRVSAQRDMCRVHRILKIMQLLQGGLPCSAPQLAVACGVSRRTVYRDLDAIDKAGFTLWYDGRARTYRMHPRSFMAPLNLDASEATELAIGAAFLGGDHGIPLLDSAQGAMAKIKAGLPLDVRVHALGVAETTKIRLGPISRHTGLKDVYEAVQRAIRRSEQLECRYVSPPDATQIDLCLAPYWLIFYRHAWYVIGHSTYHRKATTLKLARIRDVSCTGRSFRRPDGLTLEKHLGNAWGIIPGGKCYDVQLRFSRPISPYIAEVNWHRTQRLRWDEGGRLLFSATVDGLDEIAWWGHGFHGHVEVLEPEALRTRITELSSPANWEPGTSILDL